MKLKFNIELADNGIVIRNLEDDTLEVHEYPNESKIDGSEDYTKTATFIGRYILDDIFDGDKYIRSDKFTLTVDIK